jgi:hypothetical protein
LQGFFHTGNVSRSDRYSAQNMHAELVKMADDGEISQESIPKVESIQGWISRYAAACKAEMSKQAINQRAPEFY